MKSASEWRVNRAWLFAYDLTLGASLRWVCPRDGGKKNLGIRMERLA
jgi:hypothetical protein